MQADEVEPAAPLSIAALVEIARNFDGGGNVAVQRAQATIAERSQLLGAVDEASAEQTTSTFERAIGSKATWGAAAAVAAAGSLVAVKRRGGADAESVDQAIDKLPPSRREFLVGMLAALAATRSPVLTSLQADAIGQPPLPLTGLNVIAIIVDDLNDYPTYMGGAPMPVITPNLDALAAESRTFHNHHVTVPVCPASRATLMWGLSVSSHGQTSILKVGDDTFGMTTTYPSLPQMAAAAGVQRHGGGKLFHADQHVDDWSSFQKTKSATQVPGGPSGTLFDYGPLLDDYNPDAILRDYCIDVMNNYSGSAPLLLMPGIRGPHLPWRVPQRFLDLYPLGDVVVPSTPEEDWDDLGPIAVAQLEQMIDFYGKGWFQVVADADARAEHLQGYLASMSHTDEIIGDILHELSSQPYADETVVMLVSDNGYHQGENFAYRKLTLRNQSTRTPLIIRGPEGSGFTPGAIREQASSLDFAATVLDILGIDSAVEGRSLRNDRPSDGLIATHLYNSASLLYDHDDGTSGRWTFHFGPNENFDPVALVGAPIAEVELYDHGADAHEYDNLLVGWTP